MRPPSAQREHLRRTAHPGTNLRTSEGSCVLENGRTQLPKENDCSLSRRYHFRLLRMADLTAKYQKLATEYAKVKRFWHSNVVETAMVLRSATKSTLQVFWGRCIQNIIRFRIISSFCPTPQMYWYKTKWYLFYSYYVSLLSQLGLSHNSVDCSKEFYKR